MLDSTHDLGQMKIELVNETNKKAELWKLLIEYGDKLSKAQQNVLQAKNEYMQIKTQIKCCEDRLRTLKTNIKAEGEFGN
mgnify:CR=1 FL=1